MKNIIYCFLSILLISCTGDSKEKITVDITEVREITIINKLHALGFDSKEKEIVIDDKEKINEIINTLKKSVKLNNRANSKMNYGFFSLYILDSENETHYFDMLYTVYDGVIIIDLNGSGDQFKNEQLEVLISSYFE